MSRFLFQQPLRTIVRFALISLFSFSLVLGWLPLAQSQLPALPTVTTNDGDSLPDQVGRYGEYETAPIRSPLDNKELFRVTSPTILNRAQVPEGKLPVEIRAKEVNERLWRVFNRTIAANQLPTVTIATLNNRPIIQISDDKSSRPLRLVTITEPDSDWNSKTLEELAQEWQEIIEDEVIRFKQLTAPGFVTASLLQALQILLGLLIASVVIWFLRRVLSHRQRILETRYEQEVAKIAEVEKAHKEQRIIQSEVIDKKEIEAIEIVDLRSHFLSTLQHQFSVKRCLDLNKFFKWALLWIFILMWYIGIARIMSIVPLLMRWSVYVWATPLALLAIWFGISLAIRVSKSLVDRFMHSWKANPLISLGEAQRIALRTTTITEALKGLITFVLVIIGIIWTLNLFNVPTNTILAGGAVIGLAISFGSQSLIKDLVNGCLILIEDQFAIGDVIEIGNKSGLVESLNLRVTQLRSGEGKLITIPNSTITDVSNLTRLWSRIDFSIMVAYENDPIKVINILKQVSKELYSEPEWLERLPEPPEVLGIDDLSHAGMLIRVWIKTAPMEQWSVGREFRLRVRQAFEINNIQIGRPQWINYTTEWTDSSEVS